MRSFPGLCTECPVAVADHLPHVVVVVIVDLGLLLRLDREDPPTRVVPDRLGTA